MPFHIRPITIVLLMLSVLCGCKHPPADDASSADSQKLPFDRQPRSSGISPSQSLIPHTTKLPEGTSIPVRLQSTLSSASSHAADSFSAIIDEAVVVDGQTMVAAGTPATGRVLEAKPAANSRAGSGLHGSPIEPGYLRIVLVSLNIGGRAVAIETSSIFAKGGSRGDRASTMGAASRATNKSRNMDIVLGPARHLNFRLAQAADLP
jgi:hypothetical protein